MRCCGSTCATTSTGPCSARSASSCPVGKTRSPWPRRLIATGFPSPTSPTPCATTTEQLEDAAQKVQEEILCAAGATETITIKRYAHLVGGCRMAADERHGVVNADHQSFAVPNLYIVDGSVLPTQGSANPALTIMALAARCADLMLEQAASRAAG